MPNSPNPSAASYPANTKTLTIPINKAVPDNADYLDCNSFQGRVCAVELPAALTNAVTFQALKKGGSADTDADWLDIYDKDASVVSVGTSHAALGELWVVDAAVFYACSTIRVKAAGNEAAARAFVFHLQGGLG